MTKALLLAAAKTICLRPSDSHRLKHAEQFIVNEMKHNNCDYVKARKRALKAARKVLSQ